MKKMILALSGFLLMSHLSFAQEMTNQEKIQEQRSLNASEKINPFSVNVFQGNKPYGTPIEQVLVVGNQPIKKIDNQKYISLCLKDSSGNIHNQYSNVESGLSVERGKDKEGEYVAIQYTRILQLQKTNIGGCDIENPIIGVRNEKVYLPVVSFYNALPAIAKDGQKSKNNYVIEIVPFDNLQK
jgi:hypothetical protein